MKLSIASGKGGTGKTLVAVGLAKTAPGNVCLVDCDVEMPNSGLFLDMKLQNVQGVPILVPHLLDDMCTGCAACSQVCRYNAIAHIKERPMIFPELCHGCGACIHACPVDALEELPRDIGVVGEVTKDNLHFVEGRLSVGEHSATPVIRAALNKTPSEGLTIVDGPPGTACAFVAAVKDSDLVLLVTEPTPFGLHDLQIALETVREMKLPSAVIINRCDAGDGRVEVFCQREGVEIAARIQEDRRIAEASALGHAAVDTVPELREVFQDLHAWINERTSHHA